MSEQSEIVRDTWEWTPQRERAALAVATNKTYAAAAKEAGVSDKSIYRWMDVPEFEARVTQLSAKVTRRAAVKIAARTEDAVDVVVDIMLFGNSRHAIRLAAAKEILDRAGVKAVEKQEVHISTDRLADMTDEELDVELRKRGLE